MGRSNGQAGQIGIMPLALVLAVLLLLAAIAFGVWAYMGRQDYKHNVDAKIAQAVTIAKQQEATAKDAAFAQAEKLPLTTYTGPSAYGSITVSYPRTWSGYVASSSNGGVPLDVYFYPGVVPSVQAQDSVYALRIRVDSISYSSELTMLNGYMKAGQLSAAPYSLPRVPDVVGVRFDGQIVPGKPLVGSMIVLPLRDKTLEIWTESPEFLNDFNKSILPNLVFSP